MEWHELEERPWRKVVVDVTGLQEAARFVDPTLTKPPILKVELLGAQPDPDQNTPKAPRGYSFCWHDPKIFSDWCSSTDVNEYP